MSSLAQQAEAAFDRWLAVHYPTQTPFPHVIAKAAWLTAYTQGAREEREACAKVAEEHRTRQDCVEVCYRQDEETVITHAAEIATAIRHREEGKQ